MHARLYLIEDDPTIHDFVRRSLAARPVWRLLGAAAMGDGSHMICVSNDDGCD